MKPVFEQQLVLFAFLIQTLTSEIVISRPDDVVQFMMNAVERMRTNDRLKRGDDTVGTNQTWFVLMTFAYIILCCISYNIARAVKCKLNGTDTAYMEWLRVGSDRINVDVNYVEFTPCQVRCQAASYIRCRHIRRWPRLMTGAEKISSQCLSELVLWQLV